MGDKIIAKILMSKKSREGCDDGGKVRVIQHERPDCTLLTDLRVEGAMSQGTQTTSGSWKRQGNSFFSRASENKVLPTPLILTQ